jgi:hypothetical protein
MRTEQSTKRPESQRGLGLSAADVVVVHTVLEGMVTGTWWQTWSLATAIVAGLRAAVVVRQRMRRRERGGPHA